MMNHDIDQVLASIHAGKSPVKSREFQSIVAAGALDEWGSYDQERHTLMTMAAACGELSWIAFLHREGASLAAPQSEGYTPLRMALSRLVPKAALALIELGAADELEHQEVKSHGRLGYLTYACAMGFSKVVEALLMHGADPNEAGPGTHAYEVPLMAACLLINSGSGIADFDNYPAVLELLLGAGAQFIEPGGGRELTRVCSSLGAESDLIACAKRLLNAGASFEHVSAQHCAELSEHEGHLQLGAFFRQIQAEREAQNLQRVVTSISNPSTSVKKRV